MSEAPKLETTAEDRKWLRLNWSAPPADEAFRQWVAGSDEAHRLVPLVLADISTLTALLSRAEEALVLSEERLLEFPDIKDLQRGLAARQTLAEVREALSDLRAVRGGTE